MVKYILYILIFLLSGCSTDFSGLEKPEEPVYIRFSTIADIQVNVSEATRSKTAEKEAAIGILGIGVQAELLDQTALAGCSIESLREWMANDVYHLNERNLTHVLGKYPSFPVEDCSAVAAYAYLPHSENVVYGEDNCYIPINLMVDSATTDWMYSGRVAKAKAEYCEDPTFVFDFRHAMTRLDMVISPKMHANDTVEILKIDLGMYNHGKGFLSLEDGLVSMDTATCCPDSVYRLCRRMPNAVFTEGGIVEQTVTWYLMPYTEIHDLRVVGVWNGKDTLNYEHHIDTSIWNSANLHPGERSVMNIRSIRK